MTATTIMNAMQCNQRRLIVLGGLIVLGVLAGAAQAEIIVPTSMNDMGYFIQADKDVYDLGETVNIFHGVTNPMDASYTFQTTQSPGFFLRVKQEGNIVWERQAFKQVFWGLTLLPEETYAQEHSWDMLDDSENLVEPGEYELVGMVGGYESASTYITIIPEPASMLILLAGGSLIFRRRRIEA